jgi:histidinol-phosphate phosphatase family protein
MLTNQSAVARGMLTENGLAILHENLIQQLKAFGSGLDAIYYCPHHPDGVAAGYNHACSCRKPKRGLLDLAMREYPIDLSRSIFIGDSPRDLFLDAGPAAGRLLVETGHTIDDSSGADAVVPSIVEATEWVVKRYGHPLPTAPGTQQPSGTDENSPPSRG